MYVNKLANVFADSYVFLECINEPADIYLDTHIH